MDCIKAIQVVGIPIFGFWYLRKHYIFLDKKEIKVPYGSYYQNIKTNKGKEILIFIPLFCFRRFLLAAVTVLFEDFLWGQLFVYIYSSMIMIVFIMVF